MAGLFLFAMIFGVMPPVCGVVAFFGLLQCAHVIFYHQPGESVFLPFVILGAALTPFWLLLPKIKNSAKRPLPPGYIRALDSGCWSVIVRADSIRDDSYDRRFQHAERDDGAPISIYKQQ
jgi:hypothetical protein